MSLETQDSTSKKLQWGGRILSAAPSLMFIMSAGMKLSNQPELLESLAHIGFPEGLVMSLGILELTCAILYLIPQTAVLGAILLTGYMGGAVAAHVRVGDPFVVQVLLGVAVWGGLFLRDARLRALLPLRKLQ